MKGRVQRFWYFLTKWSLPDRKWMQNLILRHISEMRFFVFLNVSRIRLQSLQKEIISPELFWWKNFDKKITSMPILNPLKTCKKFTEKVTGWKLLHTGIKVKNSIFIINLFRIIFLLLFSTDSKSASNSAFSDTHIEVFTKIYLGSPISTFLLKKWKKTSFINWS